MPDIVLRQFCKDNNLNFDIFAPIYRQENNFEKAKERYRIETLKASKEVQDIFNVLGGPFGVKI